MSDRLQPATSTGHVTGELSSEAITVLVNLELTGGVYRGWLHRLPRMSPERIDLALEQLLKWGLVFDAEQFNSTPRFRRWLSRKPEKFDYFRISDAGADHPALEHAMRRLNNRRSEEGSVV